MARILLTSGPTRQYIDPVRFISNASSGQMGAALADAALQAGHQVVIVSGPVTIQYPEAAEVHWVETTNQMLEASLQAFPACDGLIGVAAPCDYQPVRVAEHKLYKTGGPLRLELIETPDIVATLGQSKRDDQWTVGFALETEDVRFRALAKLQRKHCNLVVANAASAINASATEIEVLAPDGSVVVRAAGTKPELARLILQAIAERLIAPRVQDP